jgi:tripartite-type tricarboxylate transporter receptor subunit TctC
MQKKFSIWSLSVLIFFLSFESKAQNFPNKPIRMVVPFAAGGSADILSRPISIAMGQALGQTVFTEAKPGAGGNIGAEFVAKSAPDGYTLLFASLSLSTSVSFAKLNFDPRTDLKPIAGIATLPSLLLVSGKSNIKNFDDLINEAKKSNVSFASAGPTTGSHLFGELVKSRSKTNMAHIPYKGSGAAYPDLIAGRITFMFDVMGSALPQVKSGQVRAIAVTSTKRSSALPDVPTLNELGYPGFDVGTWFGIFVPSATPTQIQTRLEEAVMTALNTPEVINQLASVMAEPIPRKGADFGRWYIEDTERWAKLAKEGAVKISD